MKVLLIQPQGVGGVRFSIDNLSEEEGVLPPLGLLYIASFLKQSADHQVRVLDNQLEKLDKNGLTDFIRKEGPEVVGITCRSYYLYDTLNIAKSVKTASEKIITVVGGHHTSIFPKETVGFPEVDYIVLGEGESAFARLLDHLSGKLVSDELAEYGIISKGNAAKNIFKKQAIEDLDKLPFPDRRLTDYTRYYNIMTKSGPTTSLVSSRGCPFSCSFCTSRQERFRGRSAQNVVAEIEYCLSLGIKEISMVDDNFTVNLKRTEEICELIVKKGLKFSWDIKGRIDNINRPVLEKLYRAGCRRIQYGIETPNPRIQKVMNKNIDTEKIGPTLAMTKEVGFDTYADFMIGSPTETREEILKTIEAARRYPLDYAHFGITMLMPGTQMYHDQLCKGYIDDLWRQYATHPVAGFPVPYCRDTLERKELHRMLNLAYKSFYMLPARVLKNLFNIRSWQEAKRKIKVAFKIISERISSK